MAQRRVREFVNDASVTRTGFTSRAWVYSRDVDYVPSRTVRTSDDDAEPASLPST